MSQLLLQIGGLVLCKKGFKLLYPETFMDSREKSDLFPDPALPAYQRSFGPWPFDNHFLHIIYNLATPHHHTVSMRAPFCGIQASV
jgi:hypothetical protein